MGAAAVLVRRSLRTHRRAILGLVLVIALAVASPSPRWPGPAARPRRSPATGRQPRVGRRPQHREHIGGRQRGHRVHRSRDGGRHRGTRSSAPRGRQLDASYIGLESVALVDDEGTFLDIQPEVLGSLDGRFIDQDRVVIAEGRVPDPAANGRGVHQQPACPVRRAPRRVRGPRGGVRAGGALPADDPSGWSPLPGWTSGSSGSASSPTRSWATTSTAQDDCWRRRPSPRSTARWRVRTSGTACASEPVRAVDDAIASYESLLGPTSRSTSSAATCSGIGSSDPFARWWWRWPPSGSPAPSRRFALGALGVLRLVGAAGGDVTYVAARSGLTPGTHADDRRPSPGRLPGRGRWAR